MANTDPNNEKYKVQRGTNLDADLDAIIERFRVEENRSTSNMIEQLLKTHPRVKRILEAQAEGAVAA